MKRMSLSTKMRTSTLPAEAVTPPAVKMAFNASRCSVTKGNWVYDRSRKLPYTDQTCPYIDRQDSCQRNGRPDSDYLYWDWHLDDCILPRSVRMHTFHFQSSFSSQMK